MSVTSTVRRTVLADGLRVVTERMPGARTVSLGAWVGVGNRDEPADQAGTSHFLEHLAFKGSRDHSGRQIAEFVDASGGDMNAFTSKEYTAFYLRLPAWERDVGMDVLADVVMQPAFTDHHVDSERRVILEELFLVLDEPEDLAHDLLYETLFGDHPLGWEVLGTTETVEAITPDDIRAFHDRWYRPGNVVVVATGDVDHDAVVEAAAERFSGGAAVDAPTRTAPPEHIPGRSVVRRPTEQVNVALGWRALPYGHADRHALALANQILGGGLSSRLFQSVREDRGLAYTVYSQLAQFTDSGAVSVFAGTAPDRAQELIDLMTGEVADLVAGGITDRELEVARAGVEGGLVLGLEDSGSRMNRLGAGESLAGRVVDLDEYLAAVRAVTLDDVDRVARSVLGSRPSVAVVGPVDEDALRL